MRWRDTWIQGNEKRTPRPPAALASHVLISPTLHDETDSGSRQTRIEEVEKEKLEGKTGRGREEKEDGKVR